MALTFTITAFIAIQLADKKTRQKWIPRLRKQPFWLRYQGFIELTLLKLEGIFGKALAFKAFSVGFLLALIYPLLAFMLAWIAGGSHLFSGYALLPVIAEQHGRIVYWLGFTAGFGWLVFTVKNSETIEARARQLIGTEWGGIKLPAKVAEIVYRLLCGGVCGLLFWAFGFSLSSILTITVAGFLGTFVAVAGNYTGSLTILVVFITLPLLNALLDFISWYWSRYFLQQVIHKTATARQALIHVIKDFMIAVLLLVCLCTLLPFTAMGLNEVYGLFSAANINWQLHALNARDEPWGKGLFVGLMVVTTIIPTALHLLLAMIAASLRVGGDKLADKLTHYKDDKIMLFFVAFALLMYGLLPVFMLVFIGWLITLFIDIPVAEWLYDLTMFNVDHPLVSLPLVTLVLSGLFFMALRNERKVKAVQNN
ncbi:MAG: hypothetical protein ACI9FJ_000002 [Alteromonadaceae bacterium]